MNATRHSTVSKKASQSNRLELMRSSVRLALEVRFDHCPAVVDARLESMGDAVEIRHLFEEAIVVNSLSELEQLFKDA